LSERSTNAPFIVPTRRKASWPLDEPPPKVFEELVRLLFDGRLPDFFEELLRAFREARLRVVFAM